MTNRLIPAKQFRWCLIIDLLKYLADNSLKGRIDASQNWSTQRHPHTDWLSDKGMLDHHEIFTHFFLNPEVIFSSHTMFINASIKDFTLMHLATCTYKTYVYISRSRFRMKFYFVYSLIRLLMKCLYTV